MAQYIFETDGNYVNFNGGGGLWRLARASNCIAWRFDETGDLFFDVYDQQYIVKAENISDVVIDETPLAAASDFPDAITAVFTGIGSGGGGIESVVAGSGIDVDDTDPANPVVSATGGSSYLVYTALLSQNSTDAPTVESNGSGANTPFQNTLGGTLVWSYFDVGSFVGTLNGAFLVGKVAIFLSNGENIAFFIGGGRFTDNSIYISTYDDAGNPSNGLLNNTPIEIRVYP